MPLLHAVALGHEDHRLSTLPRQPWLEPVDLRDLDLPAPLAGDDLAESRFLLSARADALADSADYVGVLPARWDERFPLWPSLTELTTMARWLGRDRLLAPSAHPLPHHRIGSWIRRQGEVHPGMPDVLDDVHALWVSDSGHVPVTMSQPDPAPGAHTDTRTTAAPRSTTAWGTAVWGNTFIVHREEFQRLLVAFRAAFDHVQSRHGIDLPYEYRCPRCGRTRPWGVGRWSDDRHASYFYERVTGLHFATASGLTLIDHRGRPRRPTTRRQVAQWIPDALAQGGTRMLQRGRARRSCDPADARACI